MVNSYQYLLLPLNTEYKTMHFGIYMNYYNYSLMKAESYINCASVRTAGTVPNIMTFTVKKIRASPKLICSRFC